MDVLIYWILEHLAVLAAATFGAFIYYLRSDETPTKKKFASTLSGLFMALILAQPICDRLDVMKDLDFVLAGIFGLSGRWAVDMTLTIVHKFTKNKFGV